MRHFKQSTLFCLLAGTIAIAPAYAAIENVTSFIPLAQVATSKKKNSSPKKKAGAKSNPAQKRKIVQRSNTKHSETQGKIPSELTILLEAAENGDENAQYRVAASYYLGSVVDEKLHETDVHIQENPSKTFYWMNRIVGNQGVAAPAAEYSIGWLYLQGDGVPQSYELAASWFKKAALHGVAIAQYDLGLMYSDGKGVPRDKVAAYVLFNSASTSSLDAAGARERLEREMSQHDVLKAQSTTIEDLFR